MATISRLSTRPMTQSLGSVIEGIDLRDPPDPATVASIREALLDRGVLIFRDQSLSSEQMHAFASSFGTPVHIDYFGNPEDGTHQRIAAPDEIGTSSLTPTRFGTCVWHTDVTWLPKPPLVTLLRGHKVPATGGDTCWADMEAAYDGLSEPMKQMLDGLTAVYSMRPTIEREPLLKQAMLAKQIPQIIENVHPVVTVHPETGRKALFVNECSTTRIVELSANESTHVLTALFMHIRTPVFQTRWQWSDNDLAIWDNRSVQHYAVPDYEEERLMQRIELAGEKPMGSRPG